MALPVRQHDEGLAVGDPLARGVLLVPQPPFDPHDLVSRLVGSSATDPFDLVSPASDRVERVVPLGDRPFLLAVEAAESGPGPDGLRLMVRAEDGDTAPDTTHLDLAAAWATRRFSLDADMAAVCKALEATPHGAYLVKRCWPLRPPGLADPWSCLLSAIIGSRIYPGLSVRLQMALAATYGRTATFAGREYTLFPSVQQVASIAPGDLLDLKFSRQKASYLPAIAHDMLATPARYAWDRLLTLPGPEAVSVLDELHGVGPWTAGYVALRGLKHPDVFIDDPSLRRIVAPDVEHPEDLTPDEYMTRTSVYAPYRSFACHYAFMIRFGGDESAQDAASSPPPAPVKKPKRTRTGTRAQPEVDAR